MYTNVVKFRNNIVGFHKKVIVFLQNYSNIVWFLENSCFSQEYGCSFRIKKGYRRNPQNIKIINNL